MPDQLPPCVPVATRPLDDVSPLMGPPIASTISMTWDFTTKSGGIWQFLWRSASIATSQSPTTIRGGSTCSPRRSHWSSPCEHGKLLAQAHSAEQTIEALQSVVAPFSRLHRIASTARTLDTIGPTQVSQRISSFPAILQVRYQVFHRVAPLGFEQPHYTDTPRAKLL